MRKFWVFTPFIAFIVMGVFLYKGLFMDPTKLPSALTGQARKEKAG